MRITIVLPTVQRLPVGGYKVAYEYANRFAAMGHRVTLVHSLGGRSNHLPFWASQVRHLSGCDRSPGALVPWFEFRCDVAVRLVAYLDERWFPEAELTLLTAWQTVGSLSDHAVNRIARLGQVVQLVYDYEFWLTADQPLKARIEHALSHPLVKRIATSTAVQNMLVDLGVPADAVVPAGLDADALKVAVPPDARGRTVGFPARAPEHKGAKTAYRAYELVHDRLPDARWQSFGGGRVPPAPDGIVMRGSLTDAQLVDFYNECAVFVLPSWAEGWGLPAAEAMACGAALVTTANGGTEDFAIDGVNAVVVPARDPDAIADAVVGLLTDDPTRLRLAERGRELALTMDWTHATTALATALGVPGSL